MHLPTDSIKWLLSGLKYPEAVKQIHVYPWLQDIDGLVQDGSNTQALALQLPQSCIKPLMLMDAIIIQDLNFLDMKME